MSPAPAAATTATSFLRGRRSWLLFCLWATCAVLLALPAMASAKEASADLDQCANGPITALASCAGAQWQNGNLNGNQAHYFEGDSVPYRLKLADLVEDGSYVATIEWDATKAGKHALDYITSYDRTETTGAPDPLGFHANQNDVCSDYLGAAACAGGPTPPLDPASDDIPLDADMAAQPDWNGTQAPGEFKMWGGYVTNVSSYSYSGDWASERKVRVNITFTATTTTGKAVLAWGGHIADRADWGVDNSAISISGSPYHMRLLNLLPPDRSGNQDRSLTADAVIYPARVIVTKDVVPNGSQTFNFLATGATFPYPNSDSHSTSFTLGDNGSITSDKLVTFPATGTVEETVPSSLWSTTVDCGITHGLGTSGTATPAESTSTRTSSFSLGEGDTATCAYTNTFSKASPAIATDATDSVVVNNAISDNATVSGGFNPSGTVTFRIYQPGDENCEGNGGDGTLVSVETLPANSPYTVTSDDYVPTSVGTYRWRAFYSGDGNNNAVAGECNAANESTVVTKASPAIATNATAEQALGHAIKDTATISGGFNPSGTVTFRVYGPDNANCTGEGVLVSTETLPAQPNQNGDYVVTSDDYTPTSVGTYRWRAFYSGDANNNATDGACNAPNETSVVTQAMVDVEKVGPDHAYPGQTITFDITVTNEDPNGDAVGTGPVLNVDVLDQIKGEEKCATFTGPHDGGEEGHGDVSNPGQLDPGEVWHFTCTYVVNLDDVTDQDGRNFIVNVVTVTGDDKFENPVPPDTDTEKVLVLDPAMLVEKTGPATAYHGDTAKYEYTVTNTGTKTPLFNVTIDDDKCGEPTLDRKENADTDDVLENPGTDGESSERWIYTCSNAIPAHADGENPYVNKVTVTAVDEKEKEVGSNDDHALTILHPAIGIDKTGPATAQAGDRVAYNMDVSNTGDVRFAAATVVLNDPRCDGTPQLVSRNGDGSEGFLDPGDKWSYTCSAATQVGDTEVVNVATVNASDENGKPVSATDDAVTALEQPQQLVLPDRIVPGAARLLGPTGCRGQAFRVRVAGTKIAQVRFTLDGKRLKTLTKPNFRNTFAVRINPRRMKVGVHRLRAVITFERGSGTRPKTMNLSFQRCARRLAAPRFTG